MLNVGMYECRSNIRYSTFQHSRLWYYFSMQKLEKTAVALGIVILLVLTYEAMWPRSYVSAPPPPAPELDCIGEPITVTYPYTGTVNDPWDCQVQCDDDKPRYLLYSNGKATQCETPPGCNDTGEDSGITCRVNAQTKN